MKSKTKKVIVLLVLGLVFPLILNNTSNFSVEQTTFNNLKSSQVYSGIKIDALATTNTSYSGNWMWAVSQPWCYDDNGVYIIENMIIDAQTSPTGSGILIDNSKNEYFIIRNCTVYNTKGAPSNGGIKLINTNNGTLTINNCSNNIRKGIILTDDCKNITISGNTANENSHGIYFYAGCKNNTISGNTVNDNDYGIYLEGDSDNTIISGNTACNNTGTGIYVDLGCENSVISGNTANDNGQRGIYVDTTCENSVISGNTANGNGEYGIWLDRESSNSIISGNTANNNDDHGIFINYDCINITVSGNTACNNTGTGIYVDLGCENSVISGNTANYNVNGIYIDYGVDNMVSGNTANGNDYGIKLADECDNNTITENVLYNNTLGILIDSTTSGNNSIYKNFFLENEKHAEDWGTDNKWNSTSIGNYWDNHTGPDANNDGIVDSQYGPYNISGSAQSKDYLPIAEDGPPMITIYSPTFGDIYGTAAPFFNVTVNDIYVAAMWYSLDGGLHNYTFTEDGIINQSAWDEMDDGTITLTFYASDIIYQYLHNISHIGSAGVDIIKDTVAPVIIINSPTEGERFGKNAPLFNITVTEDNLDVMWYSFDGGVSTYAITNNTIFNQSAWTDLTEGDVTITFYARDLAGNEASESVTVIKSIPAGGLDPGIIITIIIVSVVGGVAVISVVYIFMKKRATPA